MSGYPLQVCNRTLVSLIGRSLVKFCRFSQILRHALAIFVEHAEIILSERVSLVGRFLVKFCRFSQILRHALPAFIEPTASGSVSLIGRFLEKFCCFI